MNPFKISGPEVTYETMIVRCCRDWEIVRSTLTWTESIDGWKREYWDWRKCGLCKEIPRPI